MAHRYVKTPTIFQMEATECGAASLSMIFGYYGRFMPMEQMRIETGVSRDGCNARNILRAARKFGLEAKGWRKSLDDLYAIEPPCIIHWDFNHFVVWEGVKGQYAYINDPAAGRRRLTRDEVDRSYTGVVLTFRKTDDFVPTKRPAQLPGLIRERLSGQIGPVAALLLMGLCLVAPGLLIPLFSQVFIDDILLSGNTGWMTGLLVMMAGTLIFKAILMYQRSLLLGRLRRKMTLISAHSFLSHMMRLPMNFYSQRYTGDLVGRVDNNANINAFLAGDLGETILNIIVAVFYLVLLMIYSPILTVVGLISTVINLIVVKAGSDAMSQEIVRVGLDQAKMSGTLYAGLNITSTLKASGAENAYVSRLHGNYAQAIRLEQQIGKHQEILNAIPSISGQITSVIILMLGGVMVMRGHLTAGMLTAYVSLLDSFTTPVNALASFAQSIQTLKSDLLNADDINNYEEDVTFHEQKRALTGKLSGEVTLDNISFGYGILDAPLVEDFSFHLDCGRSIAFVGGSGCGKSTVSKIISGLYTPWGGEVRMDGIPLREISKDVISCSVSTVSQEVVLFSGTIRDNLTLWNQSIMETDIIRAAKDACIHDMITQKPGAYDYRLTEGGSNLSGGERQRLVIARALATNPSVLIMDEATSALDPVVEKQILDNIKRRGCTCVVVAHRLSAIRDCDEILVMDHGHIIERGTHDELAAAGGPYAELIRNI